MKRPDPPDLPPTLDLGIEPDELERLVDSGPIGYLATGSDGVIRRINLTLAEWLGYRRQELVGERTLQQLLAPGDRIYLDTHLRPLLELQGEVREIAVEMVRADRSRLSVLINMVRRIDPRSGTPVVEAVFFDASERRRYERELLRERQHAERSEALLQLQYDVVTGLADTTTADEVVAVVGERSVQSLNDVSCAIWLFEAGERSAVRLGGDGSGIKPRLSRISFPDGGAAMEQLRSGRPLIIADRMAMKDTYPLICHWLGETGRGSAIIAPLITGGQLRGVLSYGLAVPHDFDQLELATVNALAGQTAQALRRAWLIESEQRGRSRLENLFRFTTLLSEAVTLDDVIAITTQGGSELLGAAGNRVALLDESTSTVRVVSGSGLGGRLETIRRLEDQAIACEAIRTGAIVTAPNRDQLAVRFPASPILAEEAFGRVIGIPLRGRDHLLGAWVLVFSQSEPPTAEDHTLIRLFAEQAGLAARRAAGHEAEVAARKQSDLRRAISEALNRSMTVTEVGNALSDEGRSAFDADVIAVYRTGTDDPETLVMVAHDGLPDDLVGAASRLSDHAGAVAGVLTSLAPVFFDDVTSPSSELPAPFDDIRWSSAALLPLVDAGSAIGLIVTLFDREHGLPTATRVALSGMAAEASMAISRARTYEVEHRVAITLQQSMLPSVLPAVEGWRIDTWYAAGSDHLLVGGDLFDVTGLPDGRIVTVVADVVGHGLGAATAMGQLRSAAKSLALDRSTPARILDGLDDFAHLTPGVMHSSICCVVMDPDGTGLYACAGHPFPMVVGADRTTVLLEDGRSPLLGVPVPGGRSEADLVIEPGSTLVLYTDGVIERRGETLDVGINRLRRHLTEVDFSTSVHPAREVSEAAGESMLRSDDVVVVCLTRNATERNDRRSAC